MGTYVSAVSMFSKADFIDQHGNRYYGSSGINFDEYVRSHVVMALLSNPEFTSRFRDDNSLERNKTMLTEAADIAAMYVNGQY